MKLPSLIWFLPGLLVSGLGLGCATAEPAARTPLAPQQTIREAEGAGATVVPQAVALLREARSAIEYAQHLPRDPDHAQRLLMRAQADADLALVLARCEAQKRTAAQLAARSQVAGYAATP